MSTATNEVLEVASEKDVDLRTAAYVLALNKINDYYETRGIDIWLCDLIDLQTITLLGAKVVERYNCFRGYI